MLTISVKNFGPIAEGSVDLKPLTIFVGPSNTGKSYMATAAYAIFKAFEGIPVNTYGFYNRRLDKLAWFQPHQTKEMRFDKDRSALIVKALWQWAKQIEVGQLIGKDLFIEEMPQEAQELASNSAKETVSDYLKSLIDQLNNNLGTIGELVRNHPSSQYASLSLMRRKPQLEVSIDLCPKSGNASLNKQTVSTSEAHIEGSDPIFLHHLNLLKQEQTSNSSGQRGDYRNLVAAVTEAGTAEFFVNVPAVTHYFPAARSGLMEGYRSISSAVVRRSPPAANLRGTTANFLGDLLLLNWGKSYQEDAPLNSAVRYIESRVVGGDVDLDTSGDLPYPEIIYKTNLGNYPLTRSSSMVSELAPLILFLKYLVRPGDLLILEEPESHLHPAAQRQLAQGIVRLVNAGVKVLITTHSDIIISQVNNLLALNQASPELIAEGGFEPEDFLSEDQVGAYLFRHNRELAGSEVVPLEIDPDTGIDEDEFADVFEAIYDESMALQRDRS